MSGAAETCQIAFKEWAVVCAAIRSGEQSLILRKGGIHEGREGFRVAHPAFWLFPTGFHQDPAALARCPDEWPASFPPGVVRLDTWVSVNEVWPVDSLERVRSLDGLHLWSAATVEQRFHYREPGLYVLAVRASRRGQPVELVDEPRYAGCRSWVELSDPVPVGELTPVLDDRDHTNRMSEIRRRLE